MAEISASMVKDLREKSGAAMMDCKKALVEAGGDFDKAFEWLRQKGIASAAKKQSRAASEGLVVGEVSADGKRGVLVEINCETDFVARNEEFQELCRKLAQVALATGCKNQEELLKQKVEGKPVPDYITEKVSKTGENIVLRRVSCLEQRDGGAVGLYVHSLGGKMGALVALQSGGQLGQDELMAVGRDIAMHIVSAKPQFVSRREVPAHIIENERRIEAGKEDLAKKPEQIRAKIVEGRVDKLMAERCLEEQSYVKDQGQTVAQFLKSKGDLKPVAFSLFILGESDPAAGNGDGH